MDAKRESLTSHPAVTLLAFIFIPISLATSIFGMNVQQINNTGKDIWEFIVTAAVLTVLAISGWGLSNYFQRGWSSMEHEKQPLGRRLSHILWLLLHRKSWSVVSSNLVLGLLTDGRYGVSDSSAVVRVRRRERLIE